MSVRKRYRAILKRMLQGSPFRNHFKRPPRGFSGIALLTDEEFEAAERRLLEPGEPSEGSKRGAALLRTMYHRS